MAVEVLSICIKRNSHVKGLKIHNHEVKITQLADDTTLILKDIFSLRTALNILYLFQQSSGLRLNYTKTEILQLGPITYSKSNPFNLNWVKERIYALGTWFFKDPQCIVNSNYRYKLNCFIDVLKKWKCRKLTWFGKITVLKSIALSKLTYCISTLETPEWFTDEVKKAIVEFMWDGKPSKIKYQTAIGDVSNGGLKLPDIHTFIVSQKASWVKRILNAENSHFLPYLSEFLPDMYFSDILSLNVDATQLSPDIPLFYLQMLHAWYQCNDNPDDVCDILTQVLWFNKNIMINKECIFYKKWYQNGIRYVNDLINDYGKICNYEQFKAKYDVKCNHFHYMALIDALPKEWKTTIKNNTVKVLMFDITEECMLKRKFNHVVKPVEEITSKDIYWKLLKDIVGAPTCIQSWQTKHGFSFDEEIWKVIFELPYKIAKSVKIREFQLKIIHRVYASKSYVSRFDKSVKNNCITCSTKCDIIHMFYNCDNVKTFWNSFELWFASHCTDIVVTLDIVIFGQTSPSSFLIN